MTDKIPIFDWLGQKVGDFVPTGSGEGCGMAIAALFVFLFYCAPVINLVGPPIAFFWVVSRPEDYPRKKLWLTLTSVLLAVWAVGIIALLASANK